MSYVPNFVSIGLFCRLWRRKTPNFAVFWTSAFCCVASWRQAQKVERRCTTTDLPLSNGIKIVSVLERFHGKIGRSISEVKKCDGQKCDGQTNRQTDRQTDRQKTQSFLAASEAGKI